MKTNGNLWLEFVGISWAGRVFPFHLFFNCFSFPFQTNKKEISFQCFKIIWMEANKTPIQSIQRHWIGLACFVWVEWSWPPNSTLNFNWWRWINWNGVEWIAAPCLCWHYLELILKLISIYSLTWLVFIKILRVDRSWPASSGFNPAQVPF